MPKLTSLANKENILPSSKTRKAKTSSRDDRHEEEEDEQEEEHLAEIRDAKRSKSINISSSTKQDKKTRRNAEEAEERQPKSSSSDSASLKRSRSLQDDDAAPISGDQERVSRKERILEEKLALITKERDQVQSQFDELREMRQTEPERLLAEWKKLAHQRDLQAEEYIKKLKSQLSSTESTKESAMSSSSDAALFRHTRDGLDDDAAAVAAWSAREKKLTQELAKLKQELATSSLAMKSRGGQGTANVGIGDEKAIRKLYEDLTGLVINKVEAAVHREKDYFRSFHAIFASDGFYNLEMKLEESESTLPSTDTHHTREDLVYVPAMNPDRDAEIIASGKLPAYLTESLRFERSSAVRFMSTLHKRLDKSAKK